MIKKILNGIRVLDFTRVLAGPYATRMLADFGAEVIKVQSKKTATGAESNDRGYFNTWNRNKKSITLDMDYQEAREIALRLVEQSDIVIENFSPRVMKNLGLHYEQLKEIKPEIIMLSMSAMGHSGPWKDYVGFGPTVQSFSGLTYLTSFSKDEPLGLGYSYSDPIVGLYGVFTVLAALENRQKTGQGIHIDLSGYETVCASIGPALIDTAVNEKDVQPEGNMPGHIPAAPYGCYPCKGEDRWCVIAAYNDDEWKALCQVMGKVNSVTDERFLSLQDRKTNAADLNKMIGKWTAEHSPEEAVEKLQARGVPSGVVQNAKDLADDPDLLANDFFVHLDHPFFNASVSDASPIKFDDHSTAGWKSAPQIGEDNEYVYRDLLGFSEVQLNTYIKEGIIS